MTSALLPAFAGRMTVEGSVAEALRHRILSGDLSAGDRLRQNEIALELGVSTTPVREALRSLTAEGLVEIDTHRGAIIRKLSHDELAEALELILVTEQLTFPAAVLRMDEATLAEAETIHQRMLVSRLPAEWALLNREFHLVLSSGCQRPRTYRMLSEALNVWTIQMRTDLEEWEGRRLQGELDHSRFLEVARSGDPVAARELVFAHTAPAIEHQRHLSSLEN